jgi:hypothetical protein
MRTRRTKIVTAVLLAVGTAWLFPILQFYLHYAHKTAFVAIIVFDALLWVVLTFSARIQPEGGGVRVEQFRIRHMQFGDLIDCAFVPFFPQTFLLVRTKHRFPMNILFCPLQLEIASGKNGRIMLADFLSSHGLKVRGRFWIAPLRPRR